jgi:hypothetical protein
LLIVPSLVYKWSINAFTNPNTAYNHTKNRDNTLVMLLQCDATYRKQSGYAASGNQNFRKLGVHTGADKSISNAEMGHIMYTGFYVSNKKCRNTYVRHIFITIAFI